MNALLLSLGSSINTPIIFESHFDLKMRKARVAYIPHAKDYLEPNDRQKYLTASVDSLKSRVKYVDVIDLYQQKMTNDKWLELYDVIWVGGGMMSPLLKSFDDTGFGDKLLKLLSAGIKYVGSSAGSMLFSDSMQVATWYPDEEESDMIDKKGLGIIPFEIFPHYNESDHVDLIKSKVDKPIVLLPDNSAIGIEGNEIRFYNQARLYLG